MNHFKNPKVEMIHETHFLQRHISHTFSEILFVVKNKNPENIEHGIQSPEIDVLVSVHFQSFLIAAHSHEGLYIDIIIYTVNICIGMVNKIMFVVPDKTVPTQNTERQGGHLIDQFT